MQRALPKRAPERARARPRLVTVAVVCFLLPLLAPWDASFAASGSDGAVPGATPGKGKSRPSRPSRPSPPSRPSRSTPPPPVLREPPAGTEALTLVSPQTVELTLPVEGLWGVLQGFGAATHVGYATYALDFVPAEDLQHALPLAQRHRLEDFPCYGRDVLALADGEVLWAHDGEMDHPPFYRALHEPGNYVIVRHAPEELTELRHLQQGSVRVKVGDHVKRGQLLGRCGNSGNAETPHLHVGFLGAVAPLATRSLRLSGYQVLSPDGHWAPGSGVPQTGQILRSTRPPRPAAIDRRHDGL